VGAGAGIACKRLIRLDFLLRFASRQNEDMINLKTKIIKSNKIAFA